ncbi:hypothetical protein Dimus_030013, partial [Dionaea muscipula]
MSHDQATTSPCTSTTPSSTPTSSSPDDQSPSSSLNDQPTSFSPTDQPTSSSLDDQLAPLTSVLPNSISPPVVSSRPTRQTRPLSYLKDYECSLYPSSTTCVARPITTST